MKISLLDRFRGCLLGAALGDAIGGRYEAQSSEHLRARFASPNAFFDRIEDELWYTDDTQMTIGIAETLIHCGEVQEERLVAAMIENYTPSRGYGRGARAVIEAMEAGRDYSAVAERYFPGGSYGNGAAMRAAPIGLAFGLDREKIFEQTRRSALPTHRHPLGIEGAQLMATAVGIASRSESLDRIDFLSTMREACLSHEFKSRFETALEIEHSEGLARLGNGIEALESVVTAITGFALSPDSYRTAVGNVILLGGDTDTIATMTGALVGAYRGLTPDLSSLVANLENSPKGRDYIRLLAERLCDRFSGEVG